MASMPASRPQIFGRDGHRVRVLIVDDEPTVVRLVERILQEAGCDTATALSGREALMVAEEQQNRFDLLLTDVVMPEMRGYELAAQLKYRNPDLPVLYLTGYSEDLFKEKAQLWQHEAFLEKPCSVKGLLEAVSLMLTPGTAGTRQSYLNQIHAFLSRPERES
jgi:two-component system cell cycle sensor histidine kinase/response regulator CckA